MPNGVRVHFQSRRGEMKAVDAYTKEALTTVMEQHSREDWKVIVVHEYPDTTYDCGFCKGTKDVHEPEPIN